MKTIDGVDFYAKNDVLHSRGGFVALDEKLEPCGIYVPGLKGYEDAHSVEELDESVLTYFANVYKSLVTGM